MEHKLTDSGVHVVDVCGTGKYITHSGKEVRNSDTNILHCDLSCIHVEIVLKWHSSVVTVDSRFSVS